MLDLILIAALAAKPPPPDPPHRRDAMTNRKELAAEYTNRLNALTDEYEAKQKALYDDYKEQAAQIQGNSAGELKPPSAAPDQTIEKQP